MKKYFLLPVLISAAFPAMSQSIVFADDALGRGYVDRPYLRYEAEEGSVSAVGNVDFINAAPYDQALLASEASNLQAAQLTAAGSYVEWKLDADADALTIRFSLPDAADGSGTRQRLAVRSGSKTLGEIELDSYWAWQYTPKANVSEKYPDNTPDPSKFARMRFDEARLVLSETIAKGSVLRIERLSDSADPMTIDFVEAEMAGKPLTLSDIAGDNKVEFAGDGTALQAFINANPGKTIFIPAGRYEIPSQIEIRAEGTRLAGAGMWHTELFFSASSDNPRTYSRRGIVCSQNNCGVSDLSITTINNKRYYLNDASKQVGKGFMGSWGTGSSWSRVRVDHFECGAWVADYSGNSTNGLTVTDCRFRNNYADGINLCSGSANCVVRNCSFRNNGDDDMASWSTGNLAHDNLFDHNTAENNWRASSLGFFGGRNQSATNLAIYDAMENGARVNADFDGTGFAKEGEILLKNISIRRCGTCQGAVGTQGDFWGNSQAGLKISAGYFYDVNNVTLEDIDLYDCRFEGVRIQSGAGKKVVNLTMRNISVNNQGDRGWAFHFFNGLQGNGTGENLTGTGCEEPLISPIPAGFDFNLENGIEDICDDTDPRAIAIAGGCVNADAILFDACGNRLSTLRCGDCIPQLAPGIYLLTAPGLKPLKFAVK